MRKKFTRAMKKEFTRQWAELFPSMGIYKNMWLMNILGPIAVGLLLEVKSGNDMYYPTLHLQSLALKTDDIYLNAEITDGFEDISSYSPPDKYIKVAKRLEEQTIVPLEGDVTLKDLIKSFKAYSMRKYYEADIPETLEIMMYLAGWAGDEAIIKEVHAFVKTRAKYLLKTNNFASQQKCDEWYEDLVTQTKNREVLQARVEEQIVALKLDHLPRRKILF